MSPPENNDPLDTLLHEQNPYVADNGFTKRVIASLPQRRARRLPRFFLLGTAIIGWITAAVWLLNEKLPPLNAYTLYSLNAQALWPWFIVLCVAASLTWAVIAAVQLDD